MACSLPLVCVALCLLLVQVNAAPLELHKTGDEQAQKGDPEQNSLDSMEEKVQETVHKAEQAASQAAQESIRRGHKAETRVMAAKQTKHEPESEDSTPNHVVSKHAKKHHSSHGVGNEDKRHFNVEVRDSWHAKTHFNPLLEAVEGKAVRRIKQHRLNRKMGGMSKLGGLSALNLMGTGGSNSYKEDTSLEDRLALEAEEEKKYENGESYGGYDDGVASDKSANWETNIQRQDAAEKQSIQAQVASESANELNQIQQAISTESQTSQGTASIGDGGATVVQVGANEMQNAQREQEQARARAEQAAHSIQAAANSVDNPRAKSFNPGSQGEQQEIANVIRQADKLSPSELKGPPPFAGGGGLGQLSSRGQPGLNLGAQELQQGAMEGQDVGQGAGMEQEMQQGMQQGMQQASEQGLSQGFNQGVSQDQPSIGGAESMSPGTAAFTGGSLGGSQSEGSLGGGALASESDMTKMGGNGASLQSLSSSMLAGQPLQSQMQGNEQALARTGGVGIPLGGAFGGSMLAGQGGMLRQGATQGMMGAGGLAPQGFVGAPIAQGMTGMVQGMMGGMGQMAAVGGLQPMAFKKSFIPIHQHQHQHHDNHNERSKLGKVANRDRAHRKSSGRTTLKATQRGARRKLTATSHGHKGTTAKKSMLTARPHRH